MNTDELCFAPIAEVARLYRKRALSPVELAERMLERVAEVEPLVNAFALVTPERLLEDARAAERHLGEENDPSLLCGIPVTVKDNIATAGIRTTAGSRILRDRVPETDAASVARLRAAGVGLLGKTNLFEFAYGEAHEDFGHVRNPWDLTRSTAGSSTGSVAAVAAGLGYGSVGTDTGGSIRVPAALTGVVGLKPTYGRVPRSGLVTTSRTLCHVGPIARTVDDLALLLGALVDERPPALDTGIEGVRLAVALPEKDELDDEVAAAVLAACAELEGQGARLTPVELPDLRVATAVLWALASAEAAEIHHEWLRDRPDDYHPVVRARLLRGELIPATAYVRAQRIRKRLVRELDAATEGADALLLPVSPITAYGLGERTVVVNGREEDVAQAVTRFTPLASVTGRPALSLPCGFSAAGLPIGLQLIGRPRAEWALLRVAHAYEAATEWHLRRPAVRAAEEVQPA